MRYFASLKVSGSIPVPLALLGRLVMNCCRLASLVRSRIAKKNVSAHFTESMSTGLVKRTMAPANGDTNSFCCGL